MTPVTVTAEQVEAFQRDGVVELGCILSTDEVGDLRERLERACFDAAGAVLPAVRDLSEEKDRPLTYSVMQVVDVHKRDRTFDHLVRRDDLLDVMEALLGPDIQLLRDQAFYKPAGHGGEIFMHQDNRYWHLDPPHAVTLWVALDDATVENGCVHFVKGSHTWGRVQHMQARDGRSILLEARVEKSGSVPIEVPVGHATVHHCQTLHWSPPNRSPRPRRAFTVEYMAAGLRQRGQPCTEHTLLRGRLPSDVVAGSAR